MSMRWKGFWSAFAVGIETLAWISGVKKKQKKMVRKGEIGKDGTEEEKMRGNGVYISIFLLYGFHEEYMTDLVTSLTREIICGQYEVRPIVRALVWLL